MDTENEVLDQDIEQEEPEQVEVVSEDVDAVQEDDDVVVVTIGDDEPEEEQAAAPEWVRDLRKKNREDQKRIRELESKLQQIEQPKKPDLGKKPTLEDFDYDADRFETALAAWFDRKREADEEAARADEEKERQDKEWQARLEKYNADKAELKVPDYEDAEAAAQELFSVTQQGIMVQGAENPALVIYALGKNQKAAKELSAIKDPVKFAFAVAKLETQLKVSGKKSPPPPEKTVSGTARSSGAIDSTLSRLREEAAKTGDFSKVMEYKRSKRRA